MPNEGMSRDEEEWEERDDPEGVEMGQREPMSEDEAMNGVNSRPPSGYEDEPRLAAKPKRRRRMPPMPSVPRGDYDEDMPGVWHPPFEVLPDGTVTGPTLVSDGAPPGPDPGDMILPDGTRVPFDPPKGSMEGAAGMFRPPGSR